MNEVQKRRQDLDPELYVNLVNRLQSQRPRRVRDNVIRFPVPTQQQEESTPAGLTAGGVFAILLALLALTAVLILLGVG